ncbi:MAG: imidazole glycerol phosphate synthase subunit HisH [Coriobacteriia bacterium]|nr:imidazole glycerol phosphate synthase subunit HisH [Coriobacteriia bacterium]
MIAVIDYRMGNLRSVQKGLEHAGVPGVVVTGDPTEIRHADGIVLPGVGGFYGAAANLKEDGTWGVLKERIGEGVPFLGICLGLQLLADIGHEGGECEGLGLVPGACERLPAGAKIPHVGWNTVEFPRESPLFSGIEESTAFYFVHSYHFVPADMDVAIGVTGYGARFVSAIQAGNLFAVQFHPEKSSKTGLALLANFGRIVEGRHS